MAEDISSRLPTIARSQGGTIKAAPQMKRPAAAAAVASVEEEDTRCIQVADLKLCSGFATLVLHVQKSHIPIQCSHPSRQIILLDLFGDDLAFAQFLQYLI